MLKTASAVTNDAPHSSPVEEVAARHKVAPITIWREIARGRLTARKIGRRTVILASDEAAWLSSIPKAGNAPAPMAA